MYGLCFFEDVDTGNVHSVSIEAYIEMLGNEMTGDIHSDVWFQRDLATSHTSLPAMAWVSNHYGNTLIPIRSDVLWACSQLHKSPGLSLWIIFSGDMSKLKLTQSMPLNKLSKK